MAENTSSIVFARRDHGAVGKPQLRKAAIISEWLLKPSQPAPPEL